MLRNAKASISYFLGSGTNLEVSYFVQGMLSGQLVSLENATCHLGTQSRKINL